MRIELQNSRYKGHWIRCEWNPTPFFDGTICSLTDGDRAIVFTDEDADRMKLLEEALKSSECTEDQLDKMHAELAGLEIKKGLTEWDNTLDGGRVKVWIQIRTGMNSFDYHEILKLEGDEEPISKIISLVGNEQTRKSDSEDRYQELLELLGHGLIRYAEKHGLLERLAADFKKPDVSDLLGEEKAK